MARSWKKTANPREVSQYTKSLTQLGLDWETRMPRSQPGPGGRRPLDPQYGIASAEVCVDKGSDLAMPGVGVSHGTHEPGKGYLGRKLPSL